MKKTFIPMMLLLAAVAGTSLVSCNKDNKKETTLTADAQKTKLDDTAAEFLAELDPDNWGSTIESVLPAVEYLADEAYFGVLRPDGLPAEVDEENGTITVDFTKAAGHYVANEDGEFEPEEGEFSDLQFAFSVEEFDYVAKVTLTNSGKELTDTGEDEDGVEHQWIVKVPSDATADLTVNGVSAFSLKIAFSYDGIDLNIDEMDGVPDLSKLVVVSSVALKAGDYTAELSQLSFDKGTAKEKFTFSRKKTLLTLDSEATGLGYDNDNNAILCDNAELSLDVLGQVQLKGSVKYNEITKATQFSLSKDVKTAQAQLDLVKPFYDIALYYDGGSTKQATLGLSAYEFGEGEDKYVEAVPVLNFADGSSYAVDEFFTEDNFAKTVEALQALILKVNEYLPHGEWMEPEFPDEPVIVPVNPNDGTK